MNPELNSLLIRARAFATELRCAIEEANGTTIPPEGFNANQWEELAAFETMAGEIESWLDDLVLRGHYSITLGREI